MGEIRSLSLFSEEPFMSVRTTRRMKTVFAIELALALGR